MSATDDAPWVRARVVSPRCDDSVIERIGPLTPYMTQTIVEDALAAGRGTTVHLELRWADSPHVLERLRWRVDLLTGRGIRVSARAQESKARARRTA
jgi:hypothetical protein